MITKPIDFNEVRKAFIAEIMKVTGLDGNHVVVLQQEVPNSPRPTRPYMGMQFTTPAAKSGDDSKDYVSASKWNSGGVRKMSIQFDCYANSHEDAYNLMSLWQSSLDCWNVQEDLRRYGIAVWIIGNVADVSQLLNTGYEGRSQMDCTFGIAFNLEFDAGAEESVQVQGAVATNPTGQTVIQTDQTIPEP